MVVCILETGRIKKEMNPNKSYIKSQIKEIIESKRHLLNENLMVKDYESLKKKLADFFTDAVKKGHIISYHKDLTSGDMDPKDFVEDFAGKVMNMIQKQILTINIRGDRNIKEDFTDVGER